MQTASVTIGELMGVLGANGVFRMVAGGVPALQRGVGQRTVQRVGVALTGHVEHLVRDRVQLIGRSEAGYLDAVPVDVRQGRLRGLVGAGFPGLVMTAGQVPYPELVDACDGAACALIVTDLESVEATDRIDAVLTHYLAPRETRHAVMVDVYGVGVLLIGPSGIGKSEVGLELVSRGHRLVADDLVLLLQHNEETVLGQSPELTRHHMEIRGLGIINIKDLFGAAAVRDRKRVELVVELVEWDADPMYDRLGVDTPEIEVLGVAVQHVRLPVRPGRSLALIIEVAARNRLLQVQGTHSARAFAARLGAHIAEHAAMHRGRPE